MYISYTDCLNFLADICKLMWTHSMCLGFYITATILIIVEPGFGFYLQWIAHTFGLLVLGLYHCSFVTLYGTKYAATLIKCTTSSTNDFIFFTWLHKKGALVWVTLGTKPRISYQCFGITRPFAAYGMK